jgi:hypothetical protein
MPRAARQILIHMQVSMAEDVEAGALLIADHYGHGVLKCPLDTCMLDIRFREKRPHMATSYQRGRGNDPVVVLGRIRSAVAVNMSSPPPHCTSTVNFCEACQDLFAAGKELLVQFHSAAL